MGSLDTEWDQIRFKWNDRLMRPVISKLSPRYYDIGIPNACVGPTVMGRDGIDLRPF